MGFVKRCKAPLRCHCLDVWPDHNYPEKRKESRVYDGVCLRTLGLGRLPTKSLVPNPEVERDEATDPEEDLGPNDAENSVRVLYAAVLSSLNLLSADWLLHKNLI